MASMAEHLLILKTTAMKYGAPILCAGDVFDKWKVAPELINFAIEHLPQMYAIPGQHDLPYHDPNEINRSAFHTLRLSGVLLPFEESIELGEDIWATPCPFGAPIPKPKAKQGRMNILVIHAYCWQQGASYPGAPPKAHISKITRRVSQYDVAVFGDNHIGFYALAGTDTTIVNCGSFMNRKIDEKDYEPSIWLLCRNGSIKRLPLDTSHDKWREHTITQKPEALIDMADFLERCKGLGSEGIDFKTIIQALANEDGVTSMIKKLLLAAIGEEEMEI